MKFSFVIILVLVSACQSDSSNDKVKSEAEKIKTIKKEEIVNSSSSQSIDNESCNSEICLELRNHDPSNRTFDIYMVNNVEVAGFQCDLPGIEISGAQGGVLEENGFNANNSKHKILAFSMQGKSIPVGMYVLTKISYIDQPSSDQVCMTNIIFASKLGTQLSNNNPECLKLN